MEKKGMPDLYTYFVPANASPAAGKMLGRMVQEMFMHFMPRCLMHALIEYDLMQMLAPEVQRCPSWVNHTFCIQL